METKLLVHMAKAGRGSERSLRSILTWAYREIFARNATIVLWKKLSKNFIPYIKVGHRQPERRVLYRRINKETAVSLLLSDDPPFNDGFERLVCILREIYKTRERVMYNDLLHDFYNRRYFQACVFPKLHAQAVRFGLKLFVIIVDFDHFKRVNDQFGHQTGDKTIVLTAKTIASCKREADSLIRLGGDEKMVVGLTKDPKGGEVLAERIRERVETESLLWLGGMLGKQTVSLGVAWADHPNFEALYKAADAALYRAKSGGRNRVCCATDTG